MDRGDDDVASSAPGRCIGTVRPWSSTVARQRRSAETCRMTAATSEIPSRTRGLTSKRCRLTAYWKRGRCDACYATAAAVERTSARPRQTLWRCRPKRDETEATVPLCELTTGSCERTDRLRQLTADPVAQTVWRLGGAVYEAVSPACGWSVSVRPVCGRRCAFNRSVVARSFIATKISCHSASMLYGGK